MAGGGGGSDLCVGPQSFRSEVLPTTPPPNFLGKANPTRPASPNFQGAGQGAEFRSVSVWSGKTPQTSPWAGQTDTLKKDREVRRDAEGRSAQRLALLRREAPVTPVPAPCLSATLCLEHSGHVDLGPHCDQTSRSPREDRSSELARTSAPTLPLLQVFS